MKALVTGGAGFIGFHLSKHLASQGHQVVICDNLSRGKTDDQFNRLLNENNVTFFTMDMTERIQLDKLDKDFDAIFHFAAINGTKNFYEMPEEVLKVNILSLINILDWVVNTKIKRILWTSSSEAYAGTSLMTNISIPTPEEIPLAISDVFNPRSSYGGSKIAGELLCVNYARAYGLHIDIMRPHNIYGPRMGIDHVIPELILKMKKASSNFSLKNIKLQIQGTGNETRAFCYIHDMTNAIMTLLKKSKGTQIYNVGNDKAEISIKELVRKIARILNLDVEIIQSDVLTGSTSRRCPDISKIKKLGFLPETDIDTGLRKTVEFYIAQ